MVTAFYFFLRKKRYSGRGAIPKNALFQPFTGTGLFRYSCETCQGFVSFGDTGVVGDCSQVAPENYPQDPPANCTGV